MADWSPENYVVEVIDCLLKQRPFDNKDDVISVIGRILESKLEKLKVKTGNERLAKRQEGLWLTVERLDSGGGRETLECGLNAGS